MICFEIHPFLQPPSRTSYTSTGSNTTKARDPVVLFSCCKLTTPVARPPTPHHTHLVKMLMAWNLESQRASLRVLKHPRSPCEAREGRDVRSTCPFWNMDLIKNGLSSQVVFRPSTTWADAAQGPVHSCLQETDRNLGLVTYLRS